MSSNNDKDSTKLNTSALDSITALEALLEINGSNNAAAGQGGGTISSHENILPSSHPQQQLFQSSPTINPQKFEPALVTSSSTVNVYQENSENLNRMPMPPNNIPLLGQAAAAAAAVNTTNNFYPMIQSLAAAAPLGNNLIFPGAAPSNGNIWNTSTPLDNIDRKRDAVHSSTNEANKLQRVRNDEIEAALRSKPQRGRRRDNLSVLERQELTRTRNREHARSTRHRKKARYEELIEKEKKYEELLRIEELCSKRRGTLITFMRLRSIYPEAKGVQSITISAPFSEEMLKIFQDPESFQYSTIPVLPADFTKCKNGLEALLRTNDILLQLFPQFKNSLQFKIRQDIKGIAFVSDNGFAMFDVIYFDSECDNKQNNEDETKSILSGFIHANFVAGSEKLKSIRDYWTSVVTMPPKTSAGRNDKQKNGGENTNKNEQNEFSQPFTKTELERESNTQSSNQTNPCSSFPSVISLDNHFIFGNTLDLQNSTSPSITTSDEPSCLRNGNFSNGENGSSDQASTHSSNPHS